jgi:DNA polymerase
MGWWSGYGRDLCVIDFETYWAEDYTLARMSVEEYVGDPRFEAICLGYWHSSKGEGCVFGHDAIGDALDGLGVWDPDAETLTLAHNMAFDGYVANAAFGPGGAGIAYPLCTVGMLRFTVHGRLTRLTLRAAAEHFGLPEKLEGEVFRGRRARDLTSHERAEMERYCRRDVEITRLVAERLGPLMTGESVPFISRSLKMYTEPVLELDLPLLREYRAELERRREEGLARLQARYAGNDREKLLGMLRSRTTFAGMLRDLGAVVPMKVSEAKVRRIAEAKAEAAALVAQGIKSPQDLARAKKLRDVIAAGPLTEALAKSDLGFMELMNSEDPEVSLLANLRAENNSSLAMSRVDAFIGVAERGSPLPVPLAPYRAHTGRYTAGTEAGSRTDGFNLQNLPKRTGDMTLRRAIRAPKGFRLVAGDSSQIEARVGAWLAGQDDLLEIFRSGRDPYVDMAADVFGEGYDDILHGAKTAKDPRHVFMRNVGKEVILSSQYGIGGMTFGRRLLQQGVRLAPEEDGHYAEARRINGLYRERFPRIRAVWRELDDLIRAAAAGGTAAARAAAARCPAFAAGRGLGVDGTGEPGPLVIRLPNGFPLVYPQLEIDDDRDVSYLQVGAFRSGPVRKKIYGGLLFNNITQGTAFAILSSQALRIPYRLVANVHDSWVALCGDKPDTVASAEKRIRRELTTPPAWAADLPLGAEVKSGYNYEVA